MAELSIKITIVGLAQFMIPSQFLQPFYLTVSIAISERSQISRCGGNSAYYEQSSFILLA